MLTVTAYLHVLRVIIMSHILYGDVEIKSFVVPNLFLCLLEHSLTAYLHLGYVVYGVNHPTAA